MKNIVAFVFLVYMPLSLSAQKLIFEQKDQLKSGIYMSFEEFKYNNPSLPFNYNDYEVTTEQPGHGPLRLNHKAINYLIKRTAENQKVLSEMFGYCDGYSVFLKLYNSRSKFTPFAKLDYIGRYSYYETVDYVSTPIIGQNNTSFSNNAVLREYLLDITDGSRIILNNLVLIKILETDSTLREQFNNEPKKNQKLKEYAIKYSNKHEADYAANLVLNIENLIYKTPSDSSYDAYYERMIRLASDPNIIEIERWENSYPNGNLKFSGIKAKHLKGNNKDYAYKIGTWRYFHKNGQLKELINYDLNQQKVGEYKLYNKSGKLIKSAVY